RPALRPHAQRPHPRRPNQLAGPGARDSGPARPAPGRGDVPLQEQLYLREQGRGLRPPLPPGGPARGGGPDAAAGLTPRSLAGLAGTAVHLPPTRFALPRRTVIINTRRRRGGRPRAALALSLRPLPQGEAMPHPGKYSNEGSDPI